jgi:hypothetical protein
LMSIATCTEVQIKIQFPSSVLNFLNDSFLKAISTIKFGIWKSFLCALLTVPPTRNSSGIRLSSGCLLVCPILLRGAYWVKMLQSHFTQTELLSVHTLRRMCRVCTHSEEKLTCQW